MNTVLGFAADNLFTESNALLNKMQRAVPHFTPVTSNKWTSPRCQAGLVTTHPQRLQKSGMLAYDSVQQIACAVAGVVYDQTGDQAAAQPAQRLLSAYLQSGPACLRHVNGSFTVAWWHEQEERLVIATDKVGYRPLFYTHQHGLLLFASQLGSIAAAAPRAPQIDAAALADLLAYRHILGERTLLQDVHLLPPAAALTFEDGRTTITKYWSFEEIEVHGRYDARRLDELEAVFRRAVARSFQPNQTAILTLTGGIDSRAILAAALAESKSFHTFTDGLPGGTDMQIAQQLAAGVNRPHIGQPVYTHELGDLLPLMVAYQSGLVSTIDSHPCHYLHAPLPYHAVVSGITGETARSPWIAPRDLPHADLETAVRLVTQAAISPTAKQINVADLWQKPYRRIGGEMPAHRLRQIVQAYRYPATPLMAADYYGLDEHTRKFLNKGSLIALGNMEVAIPYIDHEWVEAILAIPLAQRVQHEIQIDLIRRLSPNLLTYPYAKTGLPLTAVSWQIRLQKQTRRVRAAVGRRLGRPAAPIERPTHLYEQWSRQEMAGALRALLMQPTAAFRAYLHGETVDALLAEHFSGRRSWQHLVSALAVFEIAHASWVEPAPLSTPAAAAQNRSPLAVTHV